MPQDVGSPDQSNAQRQQEQGLHLPLNRFNGLGFVGSSLLFGLMHGSHWSPATAAGMFFAWAAYRPGNLMDAVLAHATTNALVTLAVFASGAWYLCG